ncbi:MAG: VWA domain-containing protein [Anaerolineae bacterium]|nr:MAG: VWA domain-containing protein [Anaerolineae bacterium]
MWHRRESSRKHFSSSLGESGQAVVLLTVAFFALLAFIGIVTDAGSLYVSYTQLKRAVDAAAVAAANNIKNPSLTYSQRKTRITEAAREMIALHNVANIASLEAYTCDDADKPAAFANVCPNIAAGEPPRKLAWVQATQQAPVYFLSLFGVQSVSLTTSAIGEAATVDVVVVLDTSESMGEATAGYGPDFDPSACNAANSCEPLKTAKDAAKALVDSLFEGYDRVAVVGFDFDATMYINLSTDFNAVKSAIDSVPLHDDLDSSIVLSYGNPAAGDVNPLDVDGDGRLGDYDAVDDGGTGLVQDSFLSTCTGCGIRVAGNILKAYGRPDAVWVIVFLADGATNVSDVPPEVDVSFPNGFCGGTFNARMWNNPWCTDANPTTRHCGPYHASASECPPGSIWVGDSSPAYDVEDYAFDMADRVALLASTNPDEPIFGNDIAIYSIGLGKAAAGEHFLRYLANIGDDGTRLNDPCAGVAPKSHCGNYYYAPNASYLAQIFENIAERIYTRISQ